MSVLMRLGPHEFTIENLNYQRLERSVSARWKENFTANGNHVDQFLGANPLAVTISGVLFPKSYGGYEEALAIEATINAGRIFPLFSVSGRNFGQVKTLSCNISNENIGPNDEIIEARYNIKVSSYSGSSNRNPLLVSGGIISGLVNEIRSLF